MDPYILTHYEDDDVGALYLNGSFVAILADGCGGMPASMKRLVQMMGIWYKNVPMHGYTDYHDNPISDAIQWPETIDPIKPDAWIEAERDRIDSMMKAR